MNELYEFYKNNIITDRYKFIFWERGDIKNMSPEEFKNYINKLKIQKPDRYLNLIQRFTERGFITEAVYFFDLDDIAHVLYTTNYWKSMPNFRLNIWKKVIDDLINEYTRKNNS
jgi:hypothetical protein